MSDDLTVDLQRMSGNAVAAAITELGDDYRVLRRFKGLPTLGGMHRILDYTNVRHGVFLDTETTGTDADHCGVTELGMARFAYTTDGVILGVEDTYNGLNDPGEPIPPEVTELTGITDEMIKGQALSMARVMQLLDGTTLLVAHNADFDRRVTERLWRGEVFNRSHAWACSYRDIDWRLAGYACNKLGHLLVDVRGEFFDGHRALDDCLAGLRLLMAEREPEDGPPVTYFASLLAAARAPVYRVWAVGAPFGVKDSLKRRGYRWDGERRKCWYRDLRTADACAEEVDWLAKLARPDVVPISAFDRYSSRAG